ncbi:MULTISPECIES: HDOD domain-containing protein [unclassified Pseudomonas]|uniref:HDOD domain-containing protein n=1 Tax=unclassified Pseudomonas TaxID=196821 RepID=UPI000BDC8F15|nr:MULTISPECIES: HDOD domain-containing protein [unclassified Pseudomonas]PVZ15371.1 HD-like signal output (HDOD) protein [Pseudomonas sp. URIL14HWK12:I12]PVZ24745.1 HD-like signal output (HDOD) protein [Pseudomonas sp. URIL14HWK12:I10]PVZ34591.1 HD-like signal output (HDOD) protein [Pseudomonas sp. URIL14HWK12:I11]SNZ08741.1 HD-like signal output (HDOD) domain, no enzymatic activity [Pseudomonas sp. URIL14HWK12:I9]
MADPHSATPKVLIAEPDGWAREMLTQLMLDVRCDVDLTVCEDGHQAWAGIARSPHLIIAARELPGIDGLELLRRVRKQPRRVPFILMSERSDAASVREALPLAPTAYLTKPLNVAALRERLHTLLLNPEEEVFCETPSLMPGISLESFLESRREVSDGAPVMADVQAAVKRSLQARNLDLRQLEEDIRTDPQITAVLISAANSAARHREGVVQTLMQALTRLGATQSMNLILGLALKRSARLSDPMLAEYAETYWKLSLHTAEFGRTLARLTSIDQERCYCAGLLHCLGDLALLRCLQEWKLAGGALDEAQIQPALDQYGAGFGSALRTRWRLPLELRELIASIYALGGGVYSRDNLVMNLAGQMARIGPEDDQLEAVASGKTARLLKLSRVDLGRLRKAPLVAAAGQSLD